MATSFLTRLRRGLVLGAIVALAAPLSAQSVAAPSRPTGGAVRGRVAEAGSGAAIAGGSVSVRRGDGSTAGGAALRDDGSFQVEGLAPGRYALRFRALGYAPLIKPDVTVSADQSVVDVGVVSMSRVAALLSAQVVTAEREDVALAPDRNSYAVKNMTTASGGTAVDVLRNVPSVEVDGTNKVSLRGNENVVVQINGRPSPLRGEQLGNFLMQLPASAVKNVEVATNPSAKSDPEGSAGIINIVLTQPADLGLSGGFSAGTGTTGLANLSGNVGRQSGPLTLFTSYSFFRDSRALSGSSARANIAVPTPAFVESRIGGSTAPRSQSLTVRTEYRFTENDALSGDAVVSGGRFARTNDAFYSNLDADRDVIGVFDQFSDQRYDNLTQDFSVAFRRTGKPDATTFSSELRFTRNDNGSNNLLSGTAVQTDPAALAAASRERDVSHSIMPAWTLSGDYTHPFGPKTKLESGFKGTARSTSSEFTAAYLDAATGTFVPAPERANAFDYHEQIGAAYAVLSRKLGTVDAQAGLRAEQAATRFDVPSAPSHEARYGSLFPSGTLAWNVTPMRQLKLSYSRRISRPDPFQLNPFEYRDDARNVFHGNPSLQPEYTDAFELGLQETRSWGSVQLSPYLRKTAHAVRYIRLIDSTGVNVSTFDNVASTLTMGTDLNVTYRRGPLNLFGGGGLFRYSSDAENLPGNLSTRAFVWSTRASVTWKLSPLLDAQFFGNYRAPSNTEGGRQMAFVFTNFALRRKLWGTQGSLTLRVSDPFSMTRFGYLSADGRVTELTERRFGMRGVFITVSRSFGQQLKLRPREQDAPAQTSPAPGGP